MQHSRRTNPYPMTWEVPVAVTMGVAFLLLLGIQAGRSGANLLSGNGWVFVDRRDLFTSLPGIVGGHADAGLSGVGMAATPTLMWTCIAATEVSVLAVLIIAGRWAWNRWGPRRMQGMATREEAEATLGRARLRKQAKLIRPDLYGRGARR